MGFSLVIWKRRDLFTPRLVFTVLFMSLASFNFGYDTSLFSAVQGMPSFTKEFGTLDPTTGKYAFPSYLSSIMNSTPFLGKLIGAWISGPVAKRWGRKILMIFIAVIAIIGVILQETTHSAAQYTVGRILCYMTTGITINVVPIYQAETAPAELRGALVSSLQLWIGVGQLLSAVIANATAARPGRDAWLLPTGLQFIAPVIILIGYPFIPESPRWLLWNNRREEAFKSLRFLRPDSHSDESIHYELDLLLEADRNSPPSGRWADLFQGTNRRRTMIAVGAMLGQQITGQAFVSQYQTVFFIQQGVTNPSPFVINIISTASSLAALLIVSLIIDTFGRRPILLVGGSMMAMWIFIVGGMGSEGQHHPLSDSKKSFMVAALLLYSKSYGMSWAQLPYVVMSEVAANHTREKTALLATSLSIICTFLTTFTVPYLVNAPYANLGAKVGYIYGSLSLATVIWTAIFLPETKNRTLEELEEMFEAKVSTFKFGSYVTNGIGRQIAAAEDGGVKSVSAITVSELSDDKLGN